MAAPKKASKRTNKPSETPEGREKQLVNLAVNLAEKQLMDGTASPSVVTHFLKIASTRADIEKQKLEKELEYLRAKTAAIDKAAKDENIAQEAIAAMKSYAPNGT